MKLLFISIGLFFITSCKEKEELPKKWVFVETIEVKGVNPIGIANVDGQLWLSDGDHNRLVQIDKGGKIMKTIDSLERPMHIDALGKTLYVPEYGKDAIEMIDENGRTVLQMKDSLDAPAGVSVYKKEKAIADFYNNRIIYFDGRNWIAFGKEGKAKGYFYYPTDVQITEDKIWVADAYNNRVQVFDKNGKFLQMMGQDQKMNAATGIFVSDSEVFITDFENDRVLIFDKEGNLKQELSKNIEKATDLIIQDGKLKIINYRNGKINVFNQVAIEPNQADMKK